MPGLGIGPLADVPHRLLAVTASPPQTALVAAVLITWLIPFVQHNPDLTEPGRASAQLPDARWGRRYGPAGAIR